MHTIELISLILNFLLGSGVVGMLIFYRSKKRTQAAAATIEEANASTSGFEALRMQVGYLSGELKETYAQIDHMQELVDEKRAQIRELMRKIDDMEIELIKSGRAQKRAEIDKCTVEQCTNRTPPRNH